LAYRASTRYNAHELATGIRRLLVAIAAGDAAQVSTTLAEVDLLAAGIGQEAPARLRHFLAQRSYEKALEFLQEAAPPAREGS
jgi:hypothetical protein